METDILIEEVSSNPGYLPDNCKHCVKKAQVCESDVACVRNSFNAAERKQFKYSFLC